METKTKTTENESLVEPCTEHSGSRKFWNATMVILIFLIVVHVSKSPGGQSKSTTPVNTKCSSSSKTSSCSVDQEFKVPVNTGSWKLVETDGKEFEYEMVAVSGIKPKYFIAINNLDHPIEMPAQKEIKIGEAKDIQRVYFLVKRGEPFAESHIKFTFKK